MTNKMITHVAIKDRNGKIWSLPKPSRHHHIIHTIHADIGDRDKAIRLLGNHVQGFLNDSGAFLTRTEAWHEAFECKQLLPPYNPINPKERRGEIITIPGLLFSEDLW